ncbi:MAG TPA: dihydroxyacetone kinase subunit DhaL [Caldilineaceae bacterium]|nr:dihydroxyacetone kinase subunit DhaL [Caldilineaceae bacterium]
MTLTKTQIITWLEQSAQVLDENKAYLTELDSPIGDADHGTNIARGFKTMIEKLPTVADKDIGAIFKLMAMTLMSAVGGASGLLYGNFFMKAAAAANGKVELTPTDVVAVFTAGRDGIVQRGRAEFGDKTMIDAWTPALDALQRAVDAGQSLSDALHATATAAEAGMKATIPLQARKGRASYLGERSIGHQDPGATSTYLLLNELAKVVSTG